MSNKIKDLYKKINELDLKYGYDFEGELLEHLKKHFPELWLDTEEKLEDPTITLFNNWGEKE